MVWRCVGKETGLLSKRLDLITRRVYGYIYCRCQWHIFVYVFNLKPVGWKFYRGGWFMCCDGMYLDGSKRKALISWGRLTALIHNTFHPPWYPWCRKSSGYSHTKPPYKYINDIISMGRLSVGLSDVALMYHCFLVFRLRCFNKIYNI